MGKERIDLIKMLKEFLEGQGYSVIERYGAYLEVSDDDVDEYLTLTKNKVENFLISVYNLGHNAGYSKGFKTMRHIQATIKEQEDEG